MNLGVELAKIIKEESLTAVFQPIYATDKCELYGYEALIRGPSDSPLASPKMLFDTALECGLLSQLELVCRKISIARFAQLELSGFLFLNVSPMIFLQTDHPHGKTLAYVKESGLLPEQVVIELSEKYPIDSPSVLQKALMHYRDLGFRIAVDDLGAGYAGLKLWSQVKPDFVKIDYYFINQLHLDPVKREFVKSILSLGQKINARVIAEGIETEQEFEQLQDLGICFGQGFLFARPESYPVRDVPAIICNHQRSTLYLPQLEQTASSLLQPAQTFHMNTRTKDVVNYFHKHATVNSIPVLDGKKPVGMMLRNDILELYSTPYGRALNERKRIKEVMNEHPVIVEANTRLDELSKTVTAEKDDQLQWHFIITDQDNYVGIGSIRDLLRQLTQQQIKHASYANPLTLLPGNVPIYRHVDRLISEQRKFYFACFDLNNFKPFNDVYGYSKGDAIIALVSNLMQNYCQANDFVGHIGGDDFVAIFERENWHHHCQLILSEFDREVRKFYNEQDLNQSGIYAKSRNGEEHFFPLLSLAVGVVAPDVSICSSHHDVAEMASEAKKQAKKFTHSAIFLSRRTKPTARCEYTEKAKLCE
ncbi:EAL domain-containing protein [Psychrobium sp. nBUS_13]|uniref:EAL domain-containing protein n=1 Tax=Psychrobium sp. nBUS_13 TaxID=3395319 RepID=UPI003EB91249